MSIYFEVIRCIVYKWTEGYAFMLALWEACNVRPNMQCLKVTPLFLFYTAETFNMFLQSHTYAITFKSCYVCIS